MKHISIMVASALLLASGSAFAEEKPVATIQINVQPNTAPTIDPVLSPVEEAVAGNLAKKSLKDRAPVTAPVLIKDTNVTQAPAIPVSPNTIAGTAPTAPVLASDPLAQRPLNTYRSLQEANQAGINPLASAPQIQSQAPASAAAAAAPEDTSVLARIKEKWVVILAGILMIAGGALLLTGRKS